MSESLVEQLLISRSQPKEMCFVCKNREILKIEFLYHRLGCNTVYMQIAVLQFYHLTFMFMAVLKNILII